MEPTFNNTSKGPKKRVDNFLKGVPLISTDMAEALDIPAHQLPIAHPSYDHHQLFSSVVVLLVV